MRSWRIPLIALAVLTTLANVTLSLNRPTVVAYGTSGTQPQGAAPVTIVNPLPVPVSDVNSSARTPVQVDFQSINYAYEVPSGKRLVIEFVSGACRASAPGQVTGVSISTSVAAQSVGHAFVPVLTATTPEMNFYAFSQWTHLYADGGTKVFVTVSSYQASITCSDLSFSGYLMNP